MYASKSKWNTDREPLLSAQIQGASLAIFNRRIAWANGAYLLPLKNYGLLDARDPTAQISWIYLMKHSVLGLFFFGVPLRATCPDLTCPLRVWVLDIDPTWLAYFSCLKKNLQELLQSHGDTWLWGPPSTLSSCTSHIPAIFTRDCRASDSLSRATGPRVSPLSCLARAPPSWWWFVVDFLEYSRAQRSTTSL